MTSLPVLLPDPIFLVAGSLSLISRSFWGFHVPSRGLCLCVSDSMFLLGGLCLGVSVQGGLCPGGLCQEEPPDRDPPYSDELVVHILLIAFLFYTYVSA